LKNLFLRLNNDDMTSPEILALNYLNENEIKKASFCIDHLDTDLAKVIKFLCGRCGVKKYSWYYGTDDLKINWNFLDDPIFENEYYELRKIFEYLKDLGKISIDMTKTKCCYGHFVNAFNVDDQQERESLFLKAFDEGCWRGILDMAWNEMKNLCKQNNKAFEYLNKIQHLTRHKLFYRLYGECLYHGINCQQNKKLAKKYLKKTDHKPTIYCDGDKMEAIRFMETLNGTDKKKPAVYLIFTRPSQVYNLIHSYINDDKIHLDNFGYILISKWGDNFDDQTIKDWVQKSRVKHEMFKYMRKWNKKERKAVYFKGDNDFYKKKIYERFTKLKLNFIDIPENICESVYNLYHCHILTKNDSDEWYYYHGVFYYLFEQYDKMIDRFSLIKDPKINLSLYMGKYYMITRNYQKALEEFYKCDQSNEQVLLDIGKILVRLDNHSLAINTIKNIKSSNKYDILLTCYLRLNDIDNIKDILCKCTIFKISEHAKDFVNVMTLNNIEELFDKLYNKETNDKYDKKMINDIIKEINQFCIIHQKLKNKVFCVICYENNPEAIKFCKCRRSLMCIECFVNCPRCVNCEN